jgi:hypothetical protein
MNAGACWGKNTIGPREAGVLKKPQEATLTFTLPHASTSAAATTPITTATAAAATTTTSVLLLLLVLVVLLLVVTNNTTTFCYSFSLSPEWQLRRRRRNGLVG